MKIKRYFPSFVDSDEEIFEIEPAVEAFLALPFVKNFSSGINHPSDFKRFFSDEVIYDGDPYHQVFAEYINGEIWCVATIFGKLEGIESK